MITTWAAQKWATAAQVETGVRLIAEGVAWPIEPRDYPKRRHLNMQMHRIDPEQAWATAGLWFIRPDGKVIGWGYTLAEALGRRRIEAGRRKSGRATRPARESTPSQEGQHP